MRPSPRGTHCSRVEDNLLVGALPTEIGMISLMGYMRLSRNNFQGKMPTELGMLTSLSYMCARDLLCLRVRLAARARVACRADAPPIVRPHAPQCVAALTATLTISMRALACALASGRSLPTHLHRHYRPSSTK
jgi:hypothetical protein